MENTNMRQLTRRLAALEEAQGVDPALLRQELGALNDEQLDAILGGETAGSPVVMQYIQSIDALSDAELDALIEGDSPHPFL